MWAILKRALAREPEARYPTAAEMARDLDAFARSGAKPADVRSVAMLMGELFAAERQAQAASFADPTAPKPVPLATLPPRTLREPKWRNGRRSGLKIRRPRGREGSSPSFGTSVGNKRLNFGITTFGQRLIP